MVEFWDILDENRNKTGRLHERGKPMQQGDCHLVVHIWVMNNKGEFLISKRSPDVTGWAGMWQTTSGSAVAGDDSLTTALKETAEEIGVTLNPKNGQLFKQFEAPHTINKGSVFYDAWLFKQEIDISSIVLQPDETCDSMWADQEKIRQMIRDNVFISEKRVYPYLDELFAFCGNCDIPDDR
ncbi:MAG: NUDIX domain-containing protein [Oscillospiraceae bacterium]|nr:NUDIX domain-containing protein [Oscillospiraceae bacterium]